MKKLSKIIPNGDRILIKPLSEEDEVSPSGIIIPDTVEKEKTDRGEVIAVGAGKIGEDGKVIPMQIKKGQIVIFQWGDKIQFNKEEHYLVIESNILAILE